MAPSLRPILLLAVCAFVVGTESFMIAGLLPGIAADFGVSIPRAGLLNAAYSAVYAISSPLIAIIGAKIERKRLLLLSVATFSLIGLAATVAPNFGTMMVCRILLAIGAGTAMPTAIACAVNMMPPDKRGRAISIIYAGYSMAPIVGVPFGTAMADMLGWRSAYAVIACIGLAAWLGIAFALPRIPGASAVGIRQRLEVGRIAGIPSTLLVNLLSSCGIYEIYTYISVLVRQEIGNGKGIVEWVLLTWGVTGFVGTMLAARLADRVPTRLAMFWILALLTCCFSGFTIAGWMPYPISGIILFAMMMIWGLCGWSLSPILQVRLVQAAPAYAAITASINTSATYIGCSLGAGLGGIVLANGSPSNLGWVAALCELTAAAIIFTYGKRLIVKADPAEGAAELPAQG